MSRGYNFKKPGLRFRKGMYILKKILFSFDSAAYYVLWLKFLKILFLPIDFLVFIIEKVHLKKDYNQDIPIVFVVGIQRTGSTLVSQFIEKTFPFFPIGNFNSLFSRSKYILHKWIGRKYKKVNISYKNFYGISKGFFSIGDCYELWDKWFGKNHYVLPGNLDKSLQLDISNYFSFLYRAYKKPILTKNNRNSLLIPFFNQSFKNAFFVIVKRDPVAVIRSTLKASKDFFGNTNLLWGLYPNNEFDTDKYENLTEAATVQFLLLDKILEKQIRDLSNDSYLAIDYDDFCSNPSQFQKELVTKLKTKKEFNANSVLYRNEPFKTSKRLDHLEIDDQIIQYLKKWRDKI